jgi:hypothetical protein
MHLPSPQALKVGRALWSLHCQGLVQPQSFIYLFIYLFVCLFIYLFGGTGV